MAAIAARLLAMPGVDDGLVAETPIWSRATRLPHDLEHYILESYVQAPYGFWASVARGDLDVHRDWAAIRRGFTRAYALNGESVFARLDQRDVLRLVDRHRAMHQAWADLPMGGVLTVDWPPPPAQ